MFSNSRQNQAKSRSAVADAGEYKQFAFLAVALLLEFTTMIAG